MAASMGAACSGSSESDNNNGANGSEGVVSSFEVRQSIKSAARSFEIKTDDGNVYLTLSTSVQWPEEFGQFKIDVLEDSLSSLMYKKAVTTDGIDPLMAKFVSTVPDEVAMGNPSTPVDSVPSGEGVSAWSIDVSGKILEFTKKTVTYEVSTYSFLGGAHPTTLTQPFSYDLAAGQVLTLANMFKKGSEAAVLKVVAQNLADNYDVAPTALDKAGFLVSSLEKLGMPYIYNNAIVFRYDPYDIAPYAMGAVNVEVYPAQLAEYMTPEFARLMEVEDLDVE